MISVEESEPLSYSVSRSILGICCRLNSNNEQVIEALNDFLKYFPILKLGPDIYAELQFNIVWTNLEHILELQASSLLAAEPIYADEMLGVEYFLSPHWSLAVRLKQGAIVFCDLERQLAVGYVGNHRHWFSWELSHLLFYPTFSEMLKAQGRFFVHAATLAKYDKGVLFPAKTQSGKTTIALALLEKGFKILSDDLILLKRSSQSPSGIEILGFLEEMNVRSDTLKLFESLPKKLAERQIKTEGARGQGGKGGNKRRWAINVEEIYPNSVLQSVGPSLIVFPEISADGKTRFEKISAATAIKELLPHTFIIVDKKIAQEHFELICDLANSVPAYKLYAGRDLAAVAEGIERIIE